MSSEFREQNGVTTLARVGQKKNGLACCSMIAACPTFGNEANHSQNNYDTLNF
jgi:hypothetical protein